MTRATSVVRTVPALDELVRDEGTIVLLASGSDARVVRLSPVAATVRALCRRGLALDALADRLRDAYGEPPGGDLHAAVARLVEDLGAEGLVEVSSATGPGA